MFPYKYLQQLIEKVIDFLFSSVTLFFIVSPILFLVYFLPPYLRFHFTHVGTYRIATLSLNLTLLNYDQ